MIKGIGASSGVALAKVLVVNKEELHIEKRARRNERKS